MSRKITTSAFCIFAAMLAVSSPARADTLYLTCGNGGTFTVDLTNNTVNNIRANINGTSIDWDTNVGSNTPGLTAVVHHHIDRAAGTASFTATYNNNGQISTGYSGPDACTAGAAPATKF